MTERNKQKKKFLRFIIIVGAWLTVGVFGVFSIMLSLLLTTIFLNDYNQNNHWLRYLTIFGFYGLNLLLVVGVIMWGFRKRVYVKHFLIGLLVGLVIYVLIFIGGIFAYVSNNTERLSGGGVCSSPLEQYRTYGAAIVPIATDKGIGSGVVIDDQGTVVTAHHVIEGANEINANYSSGKVSMALIDSAAQYDLALLKLDKYDTTHFSLATNYVAGDDVLVYGYPFNALTAGLPSITRGVVSRILTVADLRMSEPDSPDGLEYIQTDAAVNPGNSGGALIGACGLIGIVISVSDSAQVSQYVGAVSEQGISFVVSSKTVAEAFNISVLHQ